MKICRTIAEARHELGCLRRQGKTVGFVPTMGCLHEGHLRLIDLAHQHAEVAVVSLFVNPTQFGPQEDFASYPRPFERDRELCRARGVDLLFAPSTEEMYPDPQTSLAQLQISQLAEHLCGARRQGHFNGVMLVVAKLFNIIQPDVAIFGQKDAQQLVIIKRLVRDLNFPVKVVAAPTVRDVDGLALSSRNTYLTADQRRQAVVLHQSLRHAQSLILAGERNAPRIINQMQRVIQKAPDARIDYIEIVDIKELRPVESLNGSVLIALAVYFGRTRLIDNLVLHIDGPRVEELPTID